MVVTVSKVRVQGNEGDQFIGRLARALDQGRVADTKLFDGMLNRGHSRRTPKCPSLDERDGDLN